VDGVLVEPGDVVELASALRTLLTTAELRRRLGERARITAARYGVERFVTEVGQSLREVVQCCA
jgi:glycosyltransferase involved in cell wall biosynthesis